MRLNKYLAQKGYCSRRAADELIAARKVLVNGEVATLGVQVTDADEVRVLEQNKRAPEKLVYLAFNKPKGVITTASKRSRDTVLDYVDVPERVFPVGRLDVASEGLLLLTNDGELANRLTHPRYEHEKEYKVTVAEPINDTELTRLHKGVSLDDGPTQPTEVIRVSDKTFTIVLREGRNRQIRRMCAAVGHKVERLIRTRMAAVQLGKLKPGQYRNLTKEEMRGIKQTSNHSAQTAN